MGKYFIRRLLTAIPTLIVISFVVFAILDLAPNDPTGNLPMTIPPEVRQKIRESLGFDQPFHIRYLKWMILYRMIYRKIILMIFQIFWSKLGLKI